MPQAYLRALFLFLLFQLSLHSTAQTELSPNAEISILTCAPGNELYSVFGHSAIRIYDPGYGIDRVFNYGIFDFDTPNFYVKFIRGQLLYKLGEQKLRSFLREYRYYKRPVQEHVLLLKPKEKQAFYDFMIENYKPENRFYRYDFFYDNCASRIVDVVDTVLPGQLNWTDQPPAQQSFRELLDPYLDQQPWSDFGIDLILGLESDHIATFRQQMFLPDFIPANLGRLEVARDSAATPLLMSGKKLLQFPLTIETIPWWKKPAPLFWGLCSLVALATFLLRHDHVLQKMDILLFGLSGLAGALFLFMWLGTDHEACYRNMNMLWANPLYLILLPAFYRRLPKNWERVLLFFCGFLLLVSIIGIRWLPQDLNVAVIPIALMLLVRVGGLLRRLTVDG